MFDLSSNRLLLVIYILVMAAIIIGVDVAFLRDRFWLRLIVNIGIVAAFGTVYLIFLRRS
jgi:MFS-type transporter involved in bile tolerance (Atg22 family)